jgi:uroporphyrin-III C-methyltransferase
MNASRTPAEMRRPRMELLSHLPVFLARARRRADLAQAIRSRLKALIPRGFAYWAAAARRCRAAVPTAEQGSVTLVGAGPGDPELLTLRAVRALQSADVILIDDLVAPAILDFARREAKTVRVGKTGFKPSCRQDEINALMIALARAGNRVVRLKGGDPMIFGRAGEEIAACRAAGIAVEIVPGISAAQGAASRLGLSLTHRRLARRVQYLTAHDSNGRLPSDIDWASLVDPSTTTVVYMPKRTLAAFAATAMAHGLAPETPAIAVAAATRPEQQVIGGTIANIAIRLAAADPEAPVIVMIGRALVAAESTGAAGAAQEPMVDDEYAPGRYATRTTPAHRQRFRHYHAVDNAAPKDGSTIDMFSPGNVDQALHTVRGESQPRAIRGAFDPCR